MALVACSAPAGALEAAHSSNLLTFLVAILTELDTLTSRRGGSGVDQVALDTSQPAQCAVEMTSTKDC